MSQNLKTNESKRIVEIINQNHPKSVRQLVKLVKEKLPLQEEEIIDSILELQKQGKIKLGKQQERGPPLRFTSYLKSLQAAWYWTVVILVISVVLVVFLIPEDFYPYNFIRNILGAIFVLWLPGYAFIKAIFPETMPFKTSSEAMDTIERITLSIGISLALVPMVGLILNYIPWEISLASTVLSLTGLTLVFATAAAAREYSGKLKLKASSQKGH